MDQVKIDLKVLDDASAKDYHLSHPFPSAFGWTIIITPPGRCGDQHVHGHSADDARHSAAKWLTSKKVHSHAGS